MKADLNVPDNAVVSINSEIYYQNGEYANGGKAGNVKITEKVLNR